MTTTQINWKTTKADSGLITSIVERAIVLCKKHGVDYPPSDCRMDITAVHVNCMKLDLRKLLDADDFNFAHDVFGIARHINRETAQLENCFVPRCTAH